MTKLRSVSVTRASVGVLEEEAAGDLLEDGGAFAGGDLDEAEVLFGGEAGRASGVKDGGDDGFDEELGDLFGGFGVDLAVDADDATEGGDGIGGEGAVVGVEDGGAGGGAAGVGVLDDGDGGGGRVSAAWQVRWASSQQASRSTRLLKRVLCPGAGWRRRCRCRSRRCRGRRAGGGFRRSGAIGEGVVDAECGGKSRWCRRLRRAVRVGRCRDRGRGCWRWRRRRRRWWRRLPWRGASGFRG